MNEPFNVTGHLVTYFGSEDDFRAATAPDERSLIEVIEGLRGAPLPDDVRSRFEGLRMCDVTFEWDLENHLER